VDFSVSYRQVILGAAKIVDPIGFDVLWAKTNRQSSIFIIFKFLMF